MGTADNGHTSEKDAAEESVVIKDLDTGRAVHVQKVGSTTGRCSITCLANARISDLPHHNPQL